MYGAFKSYSSGQWRPFQANPAGDLSSHQIISPFPSLSAALCVQPHYGSLVSLGCPSHSAAFFHGEVCLHIRLYLAASFFFFSRLCLFPLIFLVNRSLLPPSCLYQLIYNITCLPALFSVGPVPSGIRISTSKVVWSGFFFLNELSVVVFYQHLRPRVFSPQPLA